jgi:DNA modification methylase
VAVEMVKLLARHHIGVADFLKEFPWLRRAFELEAERTESPLSELKERDRLVEIYQGHCLEAMGQMLDESVDCCITSPPFWGLRDYGVGGQIGLEKSPEEYLSRLVEVFREVRRVLRKDGTLWLQVDDSYISQGGPQVDGTKQARGSQQGAWGGRSRSAPAGYRPKNLTGIPWRLALALQADGWNLRCDVIWDKPNAMCERVRDRPTRSHEYLFLLTRSRSYNYNYEAMLEDAISQGYEKRNRRSVWSVMTQAVKGHSATFPPALVAPCILAGCPVGGVVLDPFAGSGTVGLVARDLGRRSILIELNPGYCDLARQRIYSQPALT